MKDIDLYVSENDDINEDKFSELKEQIINNIKSIKDTKYLKKIKNLIDNNK